MSGKTTKHSGATRGQSSQSKFGTVALLMGVSLAAVAIGWSAASWRRGKREGISRAVQKRVDDTLKETFPASDPPASQYFGIPTNRE